MATSEIKKFGAKLPDYRKVGVWMQPFQYYHDMRSVLLAEGRIRPHEKSFDEKQDLDLLYELPYAGSYQLCLLKLLHSAN